MLSYCFLLVDAYRHWMGLKGKLYELDSASIGDAISYHYHFKCTHQGTLIYRKVYSDIKTNIFSLPFHPPFCHRKRTDKEVHKLLQCATEGIGSIWYLFLFCSKWSAFYKEKWSKKEDLTICFCSSQFRKQHILFKMWNSSNFQNS